MTDIQFPCPHCTYQLTVNLGPVEVLASCPYCQGQIQIPPDTVLSHIPEPPVAEPPVAEPRQVFEQVSRSGISPTTTRRDKSTSHAGLVIVLAGVGLATVIAVVLLAGAGAKVPGEGKRQFARKSVAKPSAKPTSPIKLESKLESRPASIERAQESVHEVELALEELRAKQQQVEKLQKEVDALNARNAFYAERKIAIDARIAKLDERRQTELKPLEVEAQQLAIRYEANRQRLQSGRSLDADLGRAFSGPNGKPQVMRETNNLMKDQQSVIARMAEVKQSWEKIAAEIDSEYAVLSRELEQLASGKTRGMKVDPNAQPTAESGPRSDVPSLADIERLESTVLPPLRAAVEQLEQEVAGYEARLEKFRAQQRMMAGMQSAGLPAGSRFSPGPAPNANLEREARARAANGNWIDE